MEKVENKLDQIRQLEHFAKEYNNFTETITNSLDSNRKLMKEQIDEYKETTSKRISDISHRIINTEAQTRTVVEKKKTEGKRY